VIAAENWRDGGSFAISLGAFWQRLSLARQFSIVACAVSVICMYALGEWVSLEIEQSVVDHAAASTALHIDHFIAPLVQEAREQDELSPSTIEALDEVIRSPALKGHVASIKIWHRDGHILFSNNKDLIGRRFPPESSLLQAWSGAVAAEFERLDSPESEWERSIGVPLLEVYAPVRADGTGDVIVVAEFYERAQLLAEQLARAKRQSWLITVLIALSMVGALFLIVADGSRTITAQRLMLMQRISDLGALLRQNMLLRDRVERAARDATEDHERFLRRIGADLHDGPAQLIGLALLRIDTLSAAAAGEDAVLVRGVLAEALEEIRNICAGLVLPAIDDRNLLDALSFIIREHRRRTRTEVSFDSPCLPADVPRYVKICLCRFVQEGLTNAFRHAGGKGQAVAAWSDGAFITVEVSDRGLGMPPADAAADRVGLGLVGLRGRIESVGGTMTVDRHPEGGTRLTTRLPLKSGELDGKDSHRGHR
jgi:signal transduction histidine kinase